MSIIENRVSGKVCALGWSHYADLAGPWVRGDRRVPMLWTRAQVEREVEGRLEVGPA